MLIYLQNSIPRPNVATEFKRKTCYPQTFSVYRRPWPLINLTLGPSWERVVYTHDHTIFTHKINKLILITHFPNLILSTKSSAKDKRGKVEGVPIVLFFNMYYQAFSFDACDRTRTRQHTRKPICACCLSHA